MKTRMEIIIYGSTYGKPFMVLMVAPFMCLLMVARVMVGHVCRALLAYGSSYA